PGQRTRRSMRRGRRRSASPGALQGTQRLRRLAGPQDREVWVDGDGLPKVTGGGGPPAQRLLDHASMEEEQGVPRAEVQRLVRVAERFGVTAVHVELPRESIGHGHAVAPGPFALRRSQTVREVDAVV